MSVDSKPPPGPESGDPDQGRSLLSTGVGATVVLLAAIAALLYGHLDHWNWDHDPDANPQGIAGIPVDIVYHLVWVAFAAVILEFVRRALWGRSR